VLYLRAPDGRIFDLEKRAPAPVAVPAPPEPETTQTPQARAAWLVRVADVALAQGKYQEALDHLDEARALDPGAAGLSELLATAQEQRAVEEIRAQRRQALRDHLAAASGLLASRDYAGALDRVGQALRLKANDAAALALRAQINEALRATPARPAPAAPSARGEPIRARASVPDDERDLLDG
jgi:tetratricopeptide (TPR) repeat protein